MAHPGLWVWALAAALIAAGLVITWMALGTPGCGERKCPRSAHGPVARVLAKHEQAEADIRRRDGSNEGGTP